ncbi:TnsA-like heteromeric transposase endonuclease subunit [Curtobacterium flaccumfaciens pv. poinsettiae]|uniref:TnsA-like heteromeric transposase endonuclease subunit n=1 Tax=Curtobacterium poinsettiae TaxID=159612 RepID=UPI001BE10C44|nr:TnsA-like heteromeric transposase endonuclease subunit [Curtobacterium flaccumfaciens]MBT1618115.1 TnsA-like heteromeric transposase endonuclease subunit [Curtobacterium flaccumfaciens pv. poinsettiae]
MPRPARTDTVQVVIGQGLPPRPLTEVTGKDVLDQKAARIIRSYRGQRHKPVWRWFATTRRLILCESHLEAVRLDIADFDTDVVAAKAQPFWAEGNFHGKRIAHVPDFLFELRGGRFLLVNVKHPKFASTERALRASAWAAHLARSRGWDYEYWTGEREVGQFVPNVQALHGFANPARFSSDLITAVRLTGGLSMQEIVQELPSWDPRQVRATVLHLLWTGAFRADLTLPFDSSTRMERRL